MYMDWRSRVNAGGVVQPDAQGGPVKLLTAAPIAGNRTGGQIDGNGVGAPCILSAWGGYQAVDSSHNARLRFEIPPQVMVIRRVRLSFSLQPFRSGQQTTTGGTPTSGGGGSHNHQVMHLVSDVIQGVGTQVNAELHMQMRNQTGGITEVYLDHQTAWAGTSSEIYTYDTAADHTHTIPSLALNPPTGVYETGNAQGAHVLVDGIDRNAALVAPGGGYGSGSPLDVRDLDITPWVRTQDWHEVQISSTALGGVFIQVLIVCTINSN